MEVIMAASHCRYPRVLSRCKNLDAHLVRAGHCRRLVLLAFLLSSTLAVIVPAHAHATSEDYSAIAVTWNTVTEQNELRRIDLTTGMSTPLNSFDNESGFWIGGTLVTDASENRCYLLSANHDLFSFDLTSGQVVSTVGVDGIQAIKVGPSGMLYGMAYNGGTSQHELFNIDPATGALTLLSSFTLDAGYSHQTFAVRPGVNRGYIVTTAKTLYTLDLASGDVLSTLPVELPEDTQGFALTLTSDGTLFCFTSILGSAGQWRLLTIDPLTGAAEVVTPFGFESALGVLEFLLPPSRVYFYAVTVSSGDDRTLHEFDMTSGERVSSVLIGDLPVTNLLQDIEGYTTAQQPIPTLSEWGAIIFGSLLLCSVVFYIVRRKQFQHQQV
jgi:hypothetical protein